MALITESSTLGRIVADHPQTARAFEALGLDYCCSGARGLAAACDAAGLGTGEVLARLEACLAEPAPEADWASASMTELADHIEETHHAYLRRELPRLGSMLQKVAATHGARHPELRPLSEVFAEFSGELADHMLEEEGVLFPWVRRLEACAPGAHPRACSVAEPVAGLMHDHDRAGRALARMRELTAGFTAPPDACGTYCALYATLAELEHDMHRHVHKENNILFPKAVSAEAAMGGVRAPSAPKRPQARPIDLPATCGAGGCGCRDRRDT